MTRWRGRTTAGLALITASVGLVQCDRERAEAPVADAPPPLPGPAPQAALDRAGLVAALAQAGSVFAAGGPPGDGPGIGGRTFEIRLPFGCSGPDASEAAPAGLARWAWSPDRASIRLSLTPADLTESPLVLPIGETPIWDGVEGYWIARPWLASDTCPRPATPPATIVRTPGEGETAAATEIVLPIPLPPSPQTAGLVVIAGSDASRLGRRPGEAYSFVVRGSGDQPPRPPAGGYRLVLSGRIGAFPGGRAIRCTSENPDRRPVCLVAVELDHVAFEDASGARLSEWRPT